MRTVFIGFVIMLFVLSCGLAIHYRRDALYAQEQLNGERYKRLVSEEDFQKIEVQIGSLKDVLKKAQNKVDQVESVLEKTKAFNENLKVRLDKAEEIKVNLDKKIEGLQKVVSPM